MGPVSAAEYGSQGEGSQARSVATLAAAGRAIDDRVSADITRLQAEQKRVREERKRVANELRNAQKRKQRLKHRARLLSSEDLMTVIAMRETDAAVRRAAETDAPVDPQTLLEPVASGMLGTSVPSPMEDADVEREVPHSPPA